MDLAAAVAPPTLARQRTEPDGSLAPRAPSPHSLAPPVARLPLPVAGPLLPLLPEGGLARGRTIACQGPAATSLTLALAAEATLAGAWLAVVDVPWLGVEAAAELGVPLERLVRVETSRDAGAWADLVAAVLDGFELVVTCVPRRINAGVLRRVRSRIQAREGVLLAVGDPGPLGADVAMEASTPRWEGVEHGAGHLRGRRVSVVASGRRIPLPRRAELWLPGPGGVVATVEPPVVAAPALRSVG